MNIEDEIPEILEKGELKNLEDDNVLLLSLNDSFFKNCQLIINNFSEFSKVFKELLELSDDPEKYIFCNYYENKFTTNINRNDLQIFYDVVNKIIFGNGKNLDDLINLNDFYIYDPCFPITGLRTQLIVDKNFTIIENLIDIQKILKWQNIVIIYMICLMVKEKVSLF